jgi:hypothetical protein
LNDGLTVRLQFGRVGFERVTNRLRKLRVVGELTGNERLEELDELVVAVDVQLLERSFEGERGGVRKIRQNAADERDAVKNAPALGLRARLSRLSQGIGVGIVALLQPDRVHHLAEKGIEVIGIGLEVKSQGMIGVDLAPPES